MLYAYVVCGHIDRSGAARCGLYSTYTYVCINYSSCLLSELLFVTGVDHPLFLFGTSFLRTRAGELNLKFKFIDFILPICMYVGEIRHVLY